MLIRFNVSNFLSFNEMQEFSMISGKIRSKTDHIQNDDRLKLLKFGAVFGANASGKSNLVKAINFAQTMIVKGFPSKSKKLYFRPLVKNIKEPSYFEFEVKIGNKYYAYGFECILNESAIASEWLYELTPDNQKEIFIRDVMKKTCSVKLNYSSNENKNRMDVYSSDIKSMNNILFLTELNRNKNELYKQQSEFSIFREIYRWFERKLDVNYPDQPISSYSYFWDINHYDQICNIIQAFGTGITKFQLVDSSLEELATAIPKDTLKEIFDDIEKSLLKRNNSENKNHKKPTVMLRFKNNFYIIEVISEDELNLKTIQFEHGIKNNFFNISEESDGTRRILDLLEILISIGSGKTYIVDEIDRSLHPQLTYKFVETYLNFVKEKNTQLIVTTHESRLLDFDLLRRDEIWFVDKNKNGESSIYSLDAYNERFDKKIDKAYLEGRYGGVPIFNTVFPIKESRSEL